MKRTVAVTLLAALLASRALLAAEKPPEKIVGKTRGEIAFSLAAPVAGSGHPPPAADYGLTRVQRDGKELPPPANMKLDRQTGAFSWLPTESQAGDYEIAFLLKNAAGESSHAARQVSVEAPPIVPPGDRSEIAKLLRAWAKEGTAAGNVGDFYDNRDGGHSLLNTSPYPQLDRVEYTEEQKKLGLHWALQLRLLYDHVTFGNSSTASGDPAWGSNPRHALLGPTPVGILYRQYSRNHLYIYPEHRDYDPGHNGRGGGYGDLFPANTPYYIVSQGSSGSDQPFMRAVPYTLAAFRPEAKALLIERGLLMPAVQMIFRSCNKNLEKAEDYLAGKAHPTVFEGGNVDALKMVQMAHEIRRDAVPPMVQLAVFEEDLALAGQDYFDAPRGEGLFDTPCAIARVIRSTRLVHRMVVSARGSFDANNRPLKFHWAVLRGDADRIQIHPVEKDGSKVELLVPWHERRPVLPGSSMESNRVDVGVFAHNGACYSAPAFISLLYLDDEARTYAPDGRILEVGYGIGDSTLGCAIERVKARDKNYDITDWPAFLALLAPDAVGAGPSACPAELLRKRFKPEELAAAQEAAKELNTALETEKEPEQKFADADAILQKAYGAVREAKKKVEDAKKANADKPTDETKKALDAAEASLKTAEEEQKAAEQKMVAARGKFNEAQAAAHGILTRDRPALGGSVRTRIEKALNDIKDDATLFFANTPAILELAKDPAPKKALLDATNDLAKEGILNNLPQVQNLREANQYTLTPVLGGSPAAERLTKFERNRIEWLNIAILRDVVYPGLINRRFQRNYANPLLATPKSWRDVYHHDSQNRLIGWTRYEGAERKDFTADGALITKKDALGRALEARTVDYAVESDGRRPKGLKQQPGDTIRFYRYDSDADRIGHIEKTEKATP